MDPDPGRRLCAALAPVHPPLNAHPHRAPAPRFSPA